MFRWDCREYGNQNEAKFWKVPADEHGIDPTGTFHGDSYPHGNEHGIDPAGTFHGDSYPHGDEHGIDPTGIFHGDPDLHLVFGMEGDTNPLQGRWARRTLADLKRTQIPFKVGRSGQWSTLYSPVQVG